MMSLLGWEVNFGCDTQLWSSFYPPNHVRTSTLEACSIMIDALALRDTGLLSSHQHHAMEKALLCLMRLLHFKQLGIIVIGLQKLIVQKFSTLPGRSPMLSRGQSIQHLHLGSTFMYLPPNIATWSLQSE